MFQSADPKVKDIIELKFTVLVEKLQTGELKPTDVLRAYQVKVGLELQNLKQE